LTKEIIMLDNTDRTLFNVIYDQTPDNMKRKGYRLRRLEVKNFGGYHGPASVFNFDLNGAVFSGDNGAGKSTAIDAYRMLFRTHPRFNSATQEQSKDRTVETYYLGQYGKKDTGGGAKPETLREHGIKKGFMAVCGVFETDNGEVFSILRMAYFLKKGTPAEWRLITAPDDISIERDFPEWPTKGVASRTAQALGGELHSGFREFFAASGLAFGINRPDEANAAFRFIDESIGVKKMGSITGFARSNIFPRISLRESADSVITTFEEVRQSIEAVERCEAKIAGLKATTRKFGFLDKALATHETSINRRARFEQFSSLLGSAFWGRQYRKSESQRIALVAKLGEAEILEANAKAEIKAIAEAISSEGFDKIEEYKNDKSAAERRLVQVSARLKKLKAEFRAAGINLSAASQEDLTSAEQEVSRKLADIATRQQTVVDGQDDLVRAKFEAERTKSQLTESYTSLLKSKSAMDPRLLKARDTLAEELLIRKDDIPFLAELVQIREGEEAWKGVANRVLGSLGCEILIDARHAAEARGIINRGPEGSGKRGWGAKITLNEVSDFAPKTRARMAKTSLAGKLETNPASIFSEVARDLVDKHAAHECVTEAKFKVATGDACTREGSVKKGSRIIKDDRRPIDDVSSYVLGWNVEDRIELAKSALEQAQARFATTEAELEQSRGALKSLQAKENELNKLSGKELSFEDLDEKGLVDRINALAAQIEALDSPEAEDLRRKKQTAEATEIGAHKEQSRLNKEIGGKETSAQTALKNRTEKANRFRQSLAAVGRADYADRQAYRAAAREIQNAGDVQAISYQILVTVLNDLDSVVSDIRRKIDTATNSELNISRAGEAAKSAAAAFLRDFPEEGSELETDGILGDLKSAESLARGRMTRDTWAARLVTIEQSDLPRHKEKFEEKQKTFATETIQAVEGAQISYASRLKAMQSGLNAILKDLVYDPMEGTRARLRIRPSSDNDQVVKFRSCLADAIKHLYDDPEILEKKTEAVIDLIKDDTTKEGSARREAILDLTNWFEMDIEEYHCDLNGDFVSQRRFWSGKDGESGGQGERLTMLLIGAGLAYTFGAHDDTRASTGLQTIVLDEAFMHGSEDMAAAATEVLGAMGLQVIAATPAQKLQAFRGHAERIFDISKKQEQIRHVVTTYAKLDATELAQQQQNAASKPTESA
jgi:uncharacterized protein YPO0396